MGNEEYAKMFTDAIRNMNEKQIDNLENYLSCNFDRWIKLIKFPEDLAYEMRSFSEMEA